MWKQALTVLFGPPLLMLPTIGLFDLIGLHAIGFLLWLGACILLFMGVGGYFKPDPRDAYYEKLRKELEK